MLLLKHIRLILDNVRLSSKQLIKDGVITGSENGPVIMKCSYCGCDRKFTNIEMALQQIRQNNIRNRKPLCISCSLIGKRLGVPNLKNRRLKTEEEKRKFSDAAKIHSVIRYSNQSERDKQSVRMKIVLHRPEVRKKHLDAIAKTKYLNKTVDIGQVDFINKWNKLGFNFEINYQVHTSNFLAYLDGYDKAKNVVLEYDSKYHKRPKQQKADLIRQQEIIDILNPKVFWRYDSVNKKITDVYRSDINLNKMSKERY